MNCSACLGSGEMTALQDPFIRRCTSCGGDGVERTLLSRQVAEFHKTMGQPILAKPGIPPGDRIALRLKLIFEEAFELMAACGLKSQAAWLHQETMTIFGRRDTIQPDLVQVADALADLDYVVEGSRLEFGINGAPIADAVHASNMLKASGPVREDGKRLKPENWSPPDIVGELRKQGWEG
jgi:predicted HAD superfamily Cof-like phosphohydrolase